MWREQVMWCELSLPEKCLTPIFRNHTLETKLHFLPIGLLHGCILRCLCIRPVSPDISGSSLPWTDKNTYVQTWRIGDLFVHLLFCIPNLVMSGKGNSLNIFFVALCICKRFLNTYLCISTCIQKVNLEICITLLILSNVRSSKNYWFLVVLLKVKM